MIKIGTEYIFKFILNNLKLLNLFWAARLLILRLKVENFHLIYFLYLLLFSDFATSMPILDVCVLPNHINPF